MPNEYDVVVVGSGPGGYVAAIRCAQLGFHTAIVEKDDSLGGTCLNVGCIPSKALLESSYLYYHLLHHGKEQGVECADLKSNLAAMMTRKERVVKSLTIGVAGLMKKNKIDWLHGTGTFLSPTELKVKEETVRAKHFILATGSVPVEIPFLPFDERKVISSTGALKLDKVPKEMIVVGAGVIGVELGSVYARLGAKVTFVEMLDQICYPLDASIAKALMQILKKQGLEFHLSSKVVSAEGTMLKVEKGGETISLKGDVVLVSVGRKAYSEGLGLTKAGVEMGERGMVKVNRNFQTNVSHIFAIGDMIDGPMLAHKASEEGVAVAELLAGMRPHVNYMAIPNVIYTHPEVATVGLSESEAQKMGLELLIGTFPMKGNARARCAGDEEGQVKIIAEKGTERVLGLHILSANASEMIGEGVIAIENRATLTYIAHASHAHPTLSEAIKEAALNALGRTLHI